MRCRLILAAFAVIGSPACAATGQSASALGQAQAVIFTPIIAVSLSDLDFGSLTSSPTASGSVTVSSEGGATYAGGTSPACAGGGACAGIAPARFLVSGEAGRA